MHAPTEEAVLQALSAVRDPDLNRDIVSLKSVRNLAEVHVLAVDQLNTYDVLCADDVVFTQAAYEAFTGETVAAAKPAKKAAAKKAPAKKAAEADVEDEK